MNQRELKKILPKHIDFYQIKHGPYKGWYVSTNGKINEDKKHWIIQYASLIQTNCYTHIHGPCTYQEMISFIGV